ncbi:Hypothetical_protein [Hexamita inflata]|uniref:Hypothetical_protein n=1 Tax=Hexamita inflata TaxID=28002 RepID=A0AA86V9H8_9EUKA|nr:Hypothetical protein HINF_LOCUS47808 [Hexamita inflata]
MLEYAKAMKPAAQVLEVTLLETTELNLITTTDWQQVMKPAEYDVELTELLETVVFMIVQFGELWKAMRPDTYEPRLSFTTKLTLRLDVYVKRHKVLTEPMVPTQLKTSEFMRLKRMLESTKVMLPSKTPTRPNWLNWVWLLRTCAKQMRWMVTLLADLFARPRSRPELYIQQTLYICLALQSRSETFKVELLSWVTRPPNWQKQLVLVKTRLNCSGFVMLPSTMERSSSTIELVLEALMRKEDWLPMLYTDGAKLRLVTNTTEEVTKTAPRATHPELWQTPTTEQLVKFMVPFTVPSRPMLPTEVWLKVRLRSRLLTITLVDFCCRTLNLKVELTVIRLPSLEMTFIWLITSVLWLERMAPVPTTWVPTWILMLVKVLWVWKRGCTTAVQTLSWTSMKAFEMTLAVEKTQPLAKSALATLLVTDAMSKLAAKTGQSHCINVSLIWPSVTVMFEQILETVSFWTGQDTAKLAQFCCFTALRQLSWYGIEPCTMNVDVLYPTEMAPLFEHDTFIEYTLLLRILDWIPLYHPTKPPTYELVDTMLLLVMVPSEMTTDDWLFIQPADPTIAAPRDPTVLFCTWTMDANNQIRGDIAYELRRGVTGAFTRLLLKKLLDITIKSWLFAKPTKPPAYVVVALMVQFYTEFNAKLSTTLQSLKLMTPLACEFAETELFKIRGVL